MTGRLWTPLTKPISYAVGGLKFADVLPPRLAADTVARRLADPTNAARVLVEPRQWRT